MKKLQLTIVYFFVCAFFLIKSASAITVAVSIKPLHSLVSMVTEGVLTPSLIVQGNTSPHHFQLSAKSIRQLKNTDVVFIASQYLEIPIYRSLEAKNNLYKGTYNLYQMVKFKGLTLLNFSNDKIIVKSKYNHEVSGTDFHIWLDPENAKAILVAVANVLSQKDPVHTDIYKANVNKYSEKLDQLNETLGQKLSIYKNLPFVFYHNGFAYLENRYDLHSKGVIQTGSHAVSHFLVNTFSNKSLLQLASFIKSNGIACVFVEPEFNNATLLKYFRNNHINYSVIDPIGFNLLPGIDLYFNLMLKNAEAFKRCLLK